MYRHLKNEYLKSLTIHLSPAHCPLQLRGTNTDGVCVETSGRAVDMGICSYPLRQRKCAIMSTISGGPVADLNTLTGGCGRVHSDQAKEFLSRHVMEWLKEQGIRQTFASTYASQANGVAERWINLIKTKAAVLLASKFMHTPFWCYAVAWVARCYTQKVLGQKPRKNLPEFGQPVLVRVKRNHKLEERGRLGIMAGTYPDIPNGVIALSVNNNSTQDMYTAHVAPAISSDKDRWLIKRDCVDPNQIIYASDKGEVSWEVLTPKLAAIEERIPIKHHTQYAALQRAEPLPIVGGAKHHEVTSELLNPQAKEREEEKELPSLSRNRMWKFQRLHRAELRDRCSYLNRSLATFKYVRKNWIDNSFLL